jgi:hypothetical protein
VICFIEVRFLQTYSPLRWSQRPGLFELFPSLKRSLRSSELLFSIKRDTKSPQGPPHNWCLLSWLQLSWNQERMKKKSNPSARAQMNTSLSLSLATIWLEWSLDLGEDLISLIVSCIECYSSCKVFEGWKLGCIEVWWLGVFIAPTTKRTVGEGFCRMAHRTVRRATGHCPVRQPRHPTVGFWPLELLTFGPPDSPVVHRTGPVDCPVRLLALLWLLCAL